MCVSYLRNACFQKGLLLHFTFFFNIVNIQYIYNTVNVLKTIALHSGHW